MYEKAILLVEDNDNNATVYAALLEHFGLRVLRARNGLEGVQMADEAHPDLILMDMSMPVMDGWEATRRIKASPTTASIPTVALTAHTADADIERAYEVGCDGFLGKPCALRQVLAEIERFLGPIQAAA
jgi:CheY-like chemotaxis protein